MTNLLGLGAVIGATSAAASVNPTLTYSAFEDIISSGTVFTSAATAIGAANATRIVFAVVEIQGATAAPAYSVSSATIGGVSATVHASSVRNNGVCTFILSAAVPTGTTAVTAVTINKTAAGAAVGTYYAINCLNSTPTGSQVTQGLSFTSVSLVTAAYGFVVAGLSANINANVAWTGATKNYDNAIDAGGGRATGGYVTVTDGNPLTITTSQGGGNDVAFAAISWR